MSRAALVAIVLALAGCSQAAAPEPDVPPGLGIIQGLVIDAAIVPVPDATVELAGAQTRTDADGRFRFDVEPGTYHLQVNASNMVPSQVVVTAVAGQTVQARIVLEPMPATQPFAVGSEYVGFIACEAIVAFFIESCDAGTGAFGAPDNHIFLPAIDAVPDAVQVEVVWDNTQSLGDSLTSTWASCTGDAYCDAFGWTMCQHWGASPLWCRSTADGGAASGTVGEVNSIGSVGHGRGTGVGIGLLVKADCTVCGDPVAPESGVGLVMQQRIQTYAWSFYNAMPPEDWVFFHDGPPVTPGG